MLWFQGWLAFSVPSKGLTLIVWITGPQGSGKTTLATKIVQRLAESLELQVCHIDGDEIRDGMPKKLGYSVADREFMSSTYVSFSKAMSRQGKIAIVSTVSNHSWVLPELTLFSPNRHLYVALEVPVALRSESKPEFYEQHTSLGYETQALEKLDDSALYLSAETNLEREGWVHVVIERIIQRLDQR